MATEIIWKIEKRKVADLQNWDKNPRKISNAAFEKLKKRITDRGFHDVVKIDVDGTILSGNQRKRALSELGIKEVYCIYPSRALTPTEREEVALESNVNDGEWDFSMLAKEFNTAILETAGVKIDFDLLEKDGMGDSFNLSNDEKPPFQQMTFTLANDQAESVKRAVEIAKGMTEAVGDLNENKNSNGNALATVCEMFITQYGNSKGTKSKGAAPANSQ